MSTKQQSPISINGDMYSIYVHKPSAKLVAIPMHEMTRLIGRINTLDGVDRVPLDEPVNALAVEYDDHSNSYRFVSTSFQTYPLNQLEAF